MINKESGLASKVRDYGSYIGTYERKEPVTKEVAKDVLDITKGLILDRASNLPEEGKQIIASLVKNGMSDVATTLLSQDKIRVTNDNKLEAEMDGGSLIAYFDHHTPHVQWKDPDGTTYPLSERPLSVAIDFAKSKKINEELDVDLLEESHDFNRQLMLRVGKIDITDNEYMRSEEAEGWKRMLRVLLGGKKDAKEERLALEELGVTKSGRLDVVRAKWMGMYLRFLQGTGKLESVAFDDLLVVTRHWDAEKQFDIPKG